MPASSESTGVGTVTAPDTDERIKPDEEIAPLRHGPVVLAIEDDRSASSSFTVASRLAEKLGVPLRVVTVLEPLPVYSGGELGLPVIIDPTRLQLREEYVRRRLHEVLGSEAAWTLTVRFGSVAREIANTAREVGARVIVIGAAPHRRFGSTVAGERAAQVLRLADCPVLSVDPALTALPKRAVVAVDFSPASVRAAQATLALLEDGGTLTLLHVRQVFNIGGPASARVDSEIDSTVADLFVRLRTELRPHTPPSVSLETRQAGGPVTETLLGESETLAADLVALGTHGPGLVERLLIGSVASSVLHTATRSVLVAPPPAPGDRFGINLRLAGTATTAAEPAWAQVLDGVTRRNAGRLVTVEVDDPAIGAQIQATGYTLLGATYDRQDGRIELMLGDESNRRQHLTRSIEGADSVAVSADEKGNDVALEIVHGRGHTLLLFSS